VVDDGDPVGELVGLVEVLGVSRTVVPSATSAGRSPTPGCGCAGRARRRLVEEDQVRGDDDARGDVERRRMPPE
jgi:hypothetical protein